MLLSENVNIHRLNGGTIVRCQLNPRKVDIDHLYSYYTDEVFKRKKLIDPNTFLSFSSLQLQKFFLLRIVFTYELNQ